MNVFNNVILARNRQLPNDDRMIETCRSIFKSFNVNNLNVCIGWCADQVTLRSARCNDKDTMIQSNTTKVYFVLPLYACYILRPLLRSSSGVTIQKPYKGKYDKSLRGHLFTVITFYFRIILKYSYKTKCKT